MLRLYNTLSRQEEPFAPLRDNTVRMYACGLTVYNRGHIGNFRTYVCLDVLRRTLKYLCGYQVQQVVNYTDVDDKTIAGAQKAGMPLREYTDQWIRAFRDDAAQLGIETPEEMPRATDPENLRRHVRDDPRARAQRPHLQSRRLGVLQDRLAADLRTAGAARSRRPARRRARRRRRILEGRRPRLRVVEGGQARRAVVGVQRCGTRTSGLAHRVLGDGAAAARRAPIDIHAGGVDLIFPHHENEIAQAEGATKQTFSSFWVHVEHLFVENEKMSKSVGNVYTVPDVVAKGYRPSALRYLLLSSHYRKQLNFTWTGVEQAEEALRRIVDFLAKLDDVTGDGRNAELEAAVGRAREAFRDRAGERPQYGGGLAAIFDLVRDGNSAIAAEQMSAADATSGP